MSEPRYPPPSPKPQQGGGPQQPVVPPPPPVPSQPVANQQSTSVPAHYVTTSVPAKPSAYWPLSIIAVVCFFPVGGFAIYFSSQVKGRWNVGNHPGAASASRTALILGIIAIALFIVGLAARSSSGG